MNERILIVGDDSLILDTRAMLLQPLETVKSTSHGAVATLLSQPFAVVIIGQTVPGPIAQELILAARSLDSPPALIAIRFPSQMTGLDVEIHETGSWKSPGWIKERVMELLAERNS
jgi:hypothetical protein